MICLKCKKSIPDDSTFCPYCGEALPFTCPECKRTIPEDSSFCPFCGTVLSEDETPGQRESKPDITENEGVRAEVSTPAEQPLAKAHGKSRDRVGKEKHCKFCGGRINRSTKKCEKCGKQYATFRVVLFVILSVILVVSLCINATQLLLSINTTTQINALKEQIAEQDAIIQELKQ